MQTTRLKGKVNTNQVCKLAASTKLANVLACYCYCQLRPEDVFEMAKYATMCHIAM